MAKSSEDVAAAYRALAIQGSKKALCFVMEELAKEAESLVLEAPAADPRLSEKLIRAQERRHILALFSREIK